MPKPFDATLKDLVGAYPRDWLEQLGLHATGVLTTVEADLSAVTAQADRLVHVDDDVPWLLHLELQSGADPFLDDRMLRYNVLIRERHSLPVHSVVMLLRPSAEGGSLRGRVAYETVGGLGSLAFQYQLLRLWEHPVERILEGGIGTLPLAPLCELGSVPLPEVVQVLDHRYAEEAHAEAAKLWTSTYILMGLRYPPAMAAALLQGVAAMRESSTYQAILQEGLEEGIEKGRLIGARHMLLRLGTPRLGEPDEKVRTRIQSESGVERLEELVERAGTARSWEELLG